MQKSKELCREEYYKTSHNPIVCTVWKAGAPNGSQLSIIPSSTKYNFPKIQYIIHGENTEYSDTKQTALARELRRCWVVFFIHLCSWEVRISMKGLSEGNSWLSGGTGTI